jgi:hypothetical protein
MATHLEDLERILVESPNQVLVIAGAGISIASDCSNQCASWKGLLQNGIDRCRDRCHTVSNNELRAYQSLLDSNRLLPVADFIRAELTKIREGEFAQWLNDSIGSLKPHDPNVVRAIRKFGVQIATTNYDDLFETDSGLRAIVWNDLATAQFIRGYDTQKVLHLHGHFVRPESVIFDSQQYASILRDAEFQNLIRAVFTMRTILFIGCGDGLTDPHFSCLLDWASQALKRSPFSHYRLSLENEISEIANKCLGLNIQPISYGTCHADLPPFLDQLADRVSIRRVPKPIDTQLVQSQSAFELQSEELRRLKEQMAPGELLRQQLAICRSLSVSGGRRRASVEAYWAYHRLFENVSDTERTTYGLEVAEICLDDGLYREAVEILQKLESAFDSATLDTELRKRFQAVRFRGLNGLCAHDDLIDLLETAKTAGDADERIRIEAEQLEIMFLRGDLAREGIERQ